MEKLTTFLKLYISMEAWFHDDNPEVKVRAARLLIAKVIDMMIEILPRGGQGWHIPKVHGLTKVQTFIILFGCAANFYGNHGECMHQDLVKNTGNNTQKRPGSFTTQVAVCWYKWFVFELAHAAIRRADSANYTTNCNTPVELGTKRNKWACE